MKEGFTQSTALPRQTVRVVWISAAFIVVSVVTPIAAFLLAGAINPNLNQYPILPGLGALTGTCGTIGASFVLVWNVHELVSVGTNIGRFLVGIGMMGLSAVTFSPFFIDVTDWGLVSLATGFSLIGCWGIGINIVAWRNQSWFRAVSALGMVSGLAFQGVWLMFHERFLNIGFAMMFTPILWLSALALVLFLKDMQGTRP